MKRLQSLWTKLKGLRLVILAGVFTAGEAAVRLGIKLPFSDQIPEEFRGIVIVVVLALAFVLRTLASREKRRGQ